MIWKNRLFYRSVAKEQEPENKKKYSAHNEGVCREGPWESELELLLYNIHKLFRGQDYSKFLMIMKTQIDYGELQTDFSKLSKWRATK